MWAQSQTIQQASQKFLWEDAEGQGSEPCAESSEGASRRRLRVFGREGGSRRRQRPRREPSPRPSSASPAPARALSPPAPSPPGRRALPEQAPTPPWSQSPHNTDWRESAPAVCHSAKRPDFGKPPPPPPPC